MVKSIEATAAARAYITRQLHSCSAPSSHFDEPFILRLYAEFEAINNAACSCILPLLVAFIIDFLLYANSR